MQRNVGRSVVLGAIASLLASAASAQPPSYNWSGMYLGLHAGGGWASKSWHEDDGFNLGSGTAGGFIGGGQVGYNWQVGTWVFGVQGEASGSSINVDFDCSTTWRCGNNVDAMAALRASAGYAPMNSNFQVFARGGVAFAHDHLSSNWPAEDADFAASTWRAGWTVGIGAEMAVRPNWSVFVVFDHADFGEKTISLMPNTSLVPTWMVNVDQHVDTVKVGFNYRPGR